MKILAVVSDEGRLATTSDWRGVEYWPSLGAVRDSLWRRARWQTLPGFLNVRYADGHSEGGYLLSEQAEILVYACPEELTEDTVTDAVFGAGAYPLHRLVMGPRGGVRTESV